MLAPRDEAIAGECREWGRRGNSELRERVGSRCQRGGSNERERGQDLRGPVMHEDLGARPERRRRGHEMMKFDIEDVRRRDAPRMREQITAREILDRDTDEVQRGAMPGDRPIDRGAVDIDPADACDEPARQHGQLVLESDLAAEHRPGDDRAEALQGEHAIDRQPEHAAHGARWELVDGSSDRGPQLGEPVAGLRRHQEDRRVL